jgi:hypothetical protein
MNIAIASRRLALVVELPLLAVAAGDGTITRKSQNRQLDRRSRREYGAMCSSVQTIQVGKTSVRSAPRVYQDEPRGLD